MFYSSGVCNNKGLFWKKEKAHKLLLAGLLYYYI